MRMNESCTAEKSADALKEVIAQIELWGPGFVVCILPEKINSQCRAQDFIFNYTSKDIPGYRGKR